MILNARQNSPEKLSKHVLIVDDHPPNVLIASTYMEHFGYTYDTATNGIEAVECIKANDYTFVIMDVQMPRMCGLEATRAVRAYEQQSNSWPVKILAVTAQVLPGDRERCLEAGMDDYLSKPFNPEELKRKIEILIS